jgi:hypothetical protein
VRLPDFYRGLDCVVHTDMRTSRAGQSRRRSLGIAGAPGMHAARNPRLCRA